MSDGLQFERWNHTSALMARLYNSLKYGGKAVQSWEFHPFLADAGPEAAMPGKISDLKVFLPK